MEELVTIGEAARRLGRDASALRYYEQRGLIKPATRQHGVRMYGRHQLRRLAFIQYGQRLGMSLDTIAEILDGPPHEWRRVVRDQIAALEARIRDAEAARDHLGHALTCPSEHPVDQCPHLRGLLDHQLAAPS